MPGHIYMMSFQVKGVLECEQRGCHRSGEVEMGPQTDGLSVANTMRIRGWKSIDGRITCPKCAKGAVAD